VRGTRLALVQQSFQPPGWTGEEEGLNTLGHCTLLPQPFKKDRRHRRNLSYFCNLERSERSISSSDLFRM
jgi:hypothetical protein